MLHHQFFLLLRGDYSCGSTVHQIDRRAFLKAPATRQGSASLTMVDFPWSTMMDHEALWITNNNHQPSSRIGNYNNIQLVTLRVIIWVTIINWEPSSIWRICNYKNHIIDEHCWQWVPSRRIKIYFYNRSDSLVISNQPSKVIPNQLTIIRYCLPPTIINHPILSTFSTTSH